jgi:signal transduction histidine kinase
MQHRDGPLTTTAERRAPDTPSDVPLPAGDLYTRGMEHLIGVVQDLSLARSMEGVQAIVRRAARTLTRADGATFVLRTGEHCLYADEDAIAPLWKGKKFPLEACISGWTMLNRSEAIIEDIYADDRIPHDAYRATFVKSLVMVPIRKQAPIGAIGAYWATRREATAAEVKLLQALADSTSVAIENVQLYAELEDRVRARTAELEAINHELESFAYSVSHDLRAPLRAIQGFARAVQEDAGPSLAAEAKGHLDRVIGGATRMNGLIEALLELSRVSRAPVERKRIDVTSLAREIGAELAERDRARKVTFIVEDALVVDADPQLFRAALTNLLDNAWKFTSKKDEATIAVGAKDGELFVRDDGAGFEMARAARLFAPFQRLCSANEFPGTGIGLATVLRIVRRHGGDIRAESEPGQGTTFRFTLQRAAS